MFTKILGNNTELNRALQGQNLNKALKNVYLKFKECKTSTNFQLNFGGKLPKLRHRIDKLTCEIMENKPKKFLYYYFDFVGV